MLEKKTRSLEDGFQKSYKKVVGFLKNKENIESARCGVTRL